MKVKIRPSGTSGLPDLEHLYRNYRPRRSAVRSQKKVGKPKWAVQSLVSVIIFLFLLGLFKTNLPFTGSLQRGIKYLLASEIQIQPVFARIVQFASRAGDLEWPLSGNISPSSKTVISTVPAGTNLLLPVSGNVIQPYGWVTDPADQVQRFHQGIDIAAPVGTEVRAAADGRVVNLGEDRVAGRYILVQNSSKELVRYANLNEALVRTGQPVKAGDIIAKTGKPGDPRPHLHFEVIVNSRPVDPLDRLGAGFSGLNGTNKPEQR